MYTELKPIDQAYEDVFNRMFLNSWESEAPALTEAPHIVKVVATYRVPTTFFEVVYQTVAERVFGVTLNHLVLMLDDKSYELTTSGVDERLFTLNGCIDHLQTPTIFITEGQYQLYIDRISTIAKSGAKSYLVDFLSYAYSVLRRQEYDGRPLCTGFVENVLGLDITNDIPTVVLPRCQEELNRIGWF